MRRRDALRWLSGTATVAVAGCLDAVPGGQRSPTVGPADETCTAYVHRSPTPTTTAPLPWDLEINQIGLPSVPVTVEVTDRSAEPPRTVARCTARSEAQERLSFGLDPDTEYRFDGVLHRREAPEAASMTIRGRRIAPNSMLEVTVTDEAGFTIRHVHYDVPETSTG